MKKTLALLMSFILALSLVPFGAFAAEENPSEYDTLVSKAATVFPEYAEKLLNPAYNPSVFSQNAASSTLITRETRAFSDTESITYTEYSDGLILLSGCVIDYESDCPGGGGLNKDITINVTATCVNSSYKGYFYLDGVTYRLNSGVNNWDKISNAGSARNGENCTYSHRNLFVANESSTGYAHISYNLSFKIGPTAAYVKQTTLDIYVGEDTAMIYHESSD